MVDEQSIVTFFDLVSRRQLDELGRLLAEDAVFDFPKTQPLRGRERILFFFKVLYRQFPELEFAVQSVIIQGERAAVHWTNRGRGKGGELYTNEGVTWMEFAGSEIRWMSDFFKSTEKF